VELSGNASWNVDATASSHAKVGQSFNTARDIDSFKDDKSTDATSSLPDAGSAQTTPPNHPEDEEFFEFHDVEDEDIFSPRGVDHDPSLDALLNGLTQLEKDILLPLKGRIEQEDGWELVSDSKGLECSRRRVQCTNPGRERPILMWKLRQTMKGASPKEVFDLIMDGPRTPTWHRHVSSWRAVGDRAEHGAQLIATCFKGVFPVSAREALEFRAASDGAAETSGEYWIAFRSLGTLELDVPVAPKHERTYTCMAGYRIRAGAEPGTAEFTFLAHTDPGGSLSDRLVEMAGPKGGTDYVIDLQKGLDARRK